MRWVSQLFETQEDDKRNSQPALLPSVILGTLLLTPTSISSFLPHAIMRCNGVATWQKLRSSTSQVFHEGERAVHIQANRAFPPRCTKVGSRVGGTATGPVDGVLVLRSWRATFDMDTPIGTLKAVRPLHHECCVLSSARAEPELGGRYRRQYHLRGVSIERFPRSQDC